MKRRAICILVILCMLLSLAPAAHATNEVMYSLTSESYYDKTLAGVLGHISGFLTGYEFVWEADGSPASPLPDEWFSLLNGPYSGNYVHAGDPSYPGYDRYWDTGVIASDDDYHIDIFNQHILAEHGPNVSYYDIKEEWKEHYVHDWGAGFMAAYLTRYADMLPPFTGLREYGNMYYWCTEAYIENDTLGMAAPGMPQKAIELAEKFGSVTGDFDGVTWAKFGAALYSLAYTESSAYNVVTTAAECLPAGSWPKTIYDTCHSLYTTEPDWRDAVSEVAALKRNVDESDNVQTLTDINNAIIILSLLYGNNNYLDSLKIAALAGYDGDCNAATVGGIMGVIHGMQGTPAVIVSDIYANGNGKYINDTQSFFDPYIKLNYPREQSIDSIVALYQSNAEAVIVNSGGSVSNGTYYISLAPIVSGTAVIVGDYDFESQEHSAWSTSGTVRYNSSEAHSGTTSATVESGSFLAQTVTGLNNGCKYRLSCYAKTSADGTAFVQIISGEDTYTVTIRDVPDYWVRRDIEFESSASTATIKLSADNIPDSMAFFDNVTVTKIPLNNVTIYEAESAQIIGAEVLSANSASGGRFVGTIDDSNSSVQFLVNVPETAEYCMEIYYANGGNYTSSHDLIINDSKFASVYYPKTSGWDQFLGDCVRVPVELASGTNTIKLAHDINYAQIDCIKLYKMGDVSIESANPWIDTVEDPHNYLSNGTFEAGKNSWGTWAGSDGSGEGADYVEADSGYAGSHCLVHSSPQSYEVYTGQELTNIPNGHYTLSAYVQSSGGQMKCYMDAKGFGSGLDQHINIPAYGDVSWVYVEIPGILVQNGSISIGFYSKANAGGWLKVDNVKLLRETENLVCASDFESDNNAQYWGIWPGTSGVNSDASYYEAGGIDDSQRLTHCKATNYEVFTGQTLHEIQNGVYTLTAWVKGSGNNKHFVSIKNHGGEEIKQYIPETDSWEKVIIRNIPVTTNTCEIGLYSNASAYEWCSIDNITMQKTDTYVLPTDNPFDINLVTNPSFENDGAGTINGWGTWNGRDESGVSASFIENSGYDGAYRLTHYKNTDYEVFNGQTISNLIPGRYTLSAWVLGDDSTSHFLSIKNHGHPEQTVAIPNAPYPNWVEISIGDIDIYTGSCEIGVNSNASAGSWCSIDNVQLMLIDAY